MEIIAKYNEYYKDIFRFGKSFKLINIIIIIVFVSLITWLTIKSNYLIGAGTVLSILVIFLFIRYPRLWLYTVAALAGFFIRSSSNEISVLDVIFGFLYVATLFIWLFWMIVVKKERLIRNISDLILLFFFIVLILNSLIAALNGVDMIIWLREYLLFSITLFYFPIRYYLSNKKDLIRLLFILSLAILVDDFVQYYFYYKKTFTELVYVFQLGSSVRFSQTIYTSAIAFGVLFAVYNKNIAYRLYFIFFTVFTFAALVLTFSRTFWVVALLNIVIIFLFVKNQQKFRILLYSFIISAVILTGVTFVLKDKADYFVKLVEKRFISTSELKRDPSVQTRLSEYSQVMRKIEGAFLGGNGMGKPFKYFDTIKGYHNNSYFVHNGYLYFAYRLGIPLALCFFFVFLYNLFKSFILIFKCKDEFYRILLIGAFCSLILLLIANFSTTVFNNRDGVFVVIFSYALLGLSEEKIFNNINNC